MGLAPNCRIRRHVPFHSTGPVSLRSTMRLWQFNRYRFPANAAVGDHSSGKVHFSTNVVNCRHPLGDAATEVAFDFSPEYIHRCISPRERPTWLRPVFFVPVTVKPCGCLNTIGCRARKK